MSKSKSKRMRFIPQLREVLTKNLTEQIRFQGGNPERVISDAFAQWDAGGEPRTPWERGCFEVFKKVQHDIEEGQ